MKNNKYGTIKNLIKDKAQTRYDQTSVLITKILKKTKRIFKNTENI